MGRLHTFQESLGTGSLGETLLDTLYGRWWDIEAVAMDDQRRGLDRMFTRSGESLAVEYKTDTQGAASGNIFLETVSSDRNGKPGWAYSTQADAVAYYLHEDGGGRGLVFSPSELRKALHGWVRRFRVVTATNPGYHSYGVLVPVKLAATMADGTFDLAEQAADGLLGPSR